MAIGLTIYRALTSAAGRLLAGGRPARGEASESPWRAGFRGASAETELAAGSVWVHAASIGEVGTARAWIEALLADGYRPPILLTTRTAGGLERARELGGRVAARIAPHDFPRVVGAFLDAACPWRLDLIETELWPNLLLEARRRSVAAVLVSATISERSTRRLRSLDLAGARLLGQGVYALPQSDRHAERLESLGVPRERIRVIGDLKAESAAGGFEPLPFRSRPALVFGSIRPGEERVALSLAELLETHRAAAGRAGAAAAAGQAEADPLEGRSRALLVVAPRHAEGESRVRAAFRGSRFELLARDEGSRGTRSVSAWIEAISRLPGPRVALLATKGELREAYGSAWGAVVGGTFAPFGGHNPWEPAALGCPLLAGPYHEAIADAIDSLVRSGGGALAPEGERGARGVVEAWLADENLDRRGEAAARGAREASGAALRGLRALAAWGLAP